MDQLGNTICILPLADWLDATASWKQPETEAGLRCGCCWLGLALFILTMVASQVVLLMVLEMIEIGRPVVQRKIWV